MYVTSKQRKQQLIIIHQQTHKDKFVTNYFIKGFPLYVFRQSILPSSGGHFGLYIDQCTYVNIGYYTFYEIV